jgi:hypothetical protein
VLRCLRGDLYEAANIQKVDNIKHHFPFELEQNVLFSLRQEQWGIMVMFSDQMGGQMYIPRAQWEIMRTLRNTKTKVRKEIEELE